MRLLDHAAWTLAPTSAFIMLDNSCSPARQCCTYNSYALDFIGLGLPTDAGMELYPRIGKRFDIKTWTNCRMGMMGWAVLIICFAIKQHDQLGHVSYGLAASMLLMQLYIFKFFL